MTFLDAIILGIVQGLTEFIPVSSSGHLIIVQHFLSPNYNFTFNVLLNFGTLLALVIYFRLKIYNIVKDILVKRKYKFLGLLILAVLPTGLVGFLFNDALERVSNHISIIIFMLFFLGVAMIKFGKESDKVIVDTEAKLTIKDALLIGLSQVIALIPGSSRSGITILAGINRGLNFQVAANFSFLMAIPTILGATLHTLVSNEGRELITQNFSMFIIGNIFSFIFGILAVKILMNFIKKQGLVIFGWYRIGLSLVLTVLLLFKVIN